MCIELFLVEHHEAQHEAAARRWRIERRDHAYYRLADTEEVAELPLQGGIKAAPEKTAGTRKREFLHDVSKMASAQGAM